MISFSSTLLESYQDDPSAVATVDRVVWGKRAFDLVVSTLVILFVLTWLIPALGLLIRLSSPGPALYLQRRTGRNGRPFRCFKFRTMTHDQNAVFRQATRNDCRITPLGRFLRRTNIDEIPQFLNVFWGDMSVVGPRPHALQHDAQFWYTLPGYADRYRVKPGITGMAQVCGSRGETETLLKMKQRVAYDRFYICHRSLGLDLRICWKTAQQMVMGDHQAW